MNKIKLICLCIYIEYLNSKQFKLKSVFNKMKIIVFDTETTGLPKTKIINELSLPLWPHIVQFSYIISYLLTMKDFISSINLSIALFFYLNPTILHITFLMIHYFILFPNFLILTSNLNFFSLG